MSWLTVLPWVHAICSVKREDIPWNMVLNWIKELCGSLEIMIFISPLSPIEAPIPVEKNQLCVHSSLWLTRVPFRIHSGSVALLPPTHAVLVSLLCLAFLLSAYTVQHMKYFLLASSTMLYFIRARNYFFFFFFLDFAWSLTPRTVLGILLVLNKYLSNKLSLVYILTSWKFFSGHS